MLSVSKIREDVLSGAKSAKSIALDILSRIKENARLNAFVCVCDDVLQQAESVDEAVKNGFNGRLAGVPVAIKDNMDMKGYVTSCGSELLKNSPVAMEDCRVVKLLKAEGAVIIGRTNMDEFAMGSSNTTSAYGCVLNPLDNAKVPGGSSGGSAAAVAASLCAAALGSDTGGSIRQPASYCGVVGLKPTIGSIDGEGVFPLSQSFDSVGPITSTVEDCVTMFEVLSGRKIEKMSSPKKVGVISEYFDKYTPELSRLMDEVKRKFGDCELVTVSVPSVLKAFVTYCALGNKEAAINIKPLGTAMDRGEKIGKEAIKRILIGEYVLQHPSIASDALKMAKRIKSELKEALKECDVIVSPTAPSEAFAFVDDRSRAEIVYSDLFTQPPSIAGLPAISVPFFIGEHGLPIGVQIIADENREDLLFAFAKRFE